MKNSKINLLQAQAGQMLSAYSGMPNKSEYVANESFMAGKGTPQIDYEPEIQELVVNISNTDEVNALYAPLFSVNEQNTYPTPFNAVADRVGTVAGVGKGIVIEYEGYGAGSFEIRNRILTQPFTIIGARYDFGDNTQLKGNFVRRFKILEETREKPHRPRLRQELSNNVVTSLDDTTLFLPVNADSTLFVLVAKAPTALISRDIQLAFKLGTIFDQTNPMKGKPVLKKFGTAPQDAVKRLF